MPSDQNLRKTHREGLKTAFYQEFDRSLVDQWQGLSEAELGRKGVLLGTGTHFSAWRLGGLVYKRALPGTFGKGALTLRGWLAALQKAQGVGSLMPPYEVLTQGEAVSLVMPYGGEPLAKAHQAWQPIDATVKAFEADLGRAGLVLDDVVQARCRDGIPFLVDLSDLRAL